jgi:hypothetical protein
MIEKSRLAVGQRVRVDSWAASALYPHFTMAGNDGVISRILPSGEVVEVRFDRPLNSRGARSELLSHLDLVEATP